MNPGVVIGTVALLIGVISLAGAIGLRNSTRSTPQDLLRFMFQIGIPILLLCSAAGFWECYTSGDWSKVLTPLAMLLFAVNALILRSQFLNTAGRLHDSQPAASKTVTEDLSDRPR